MNKEIIDKVSIIVPIYNAEQYLPKCIESILTQTYADLEVVLVDDGSPDNCGIICDEYAARDSRIMVIHKANGGVTSARRAGTQRATGVWISFVDADDLLPAKAIENLIRNAEGVDIVKGGFRLVEPGKFKEYVFESNKEISGHDFIVNALHNKLIFLPLWGAIYKRSIIEPSVFDVSPAMIINGEDRLNLIHICLKADSIRLITGVVYEYIQHNTSATHSFAPTYDYSVVYDDCLMKIFRESGSIEIYQDELLRFRISLLMQLMGSRTMKMSSELLRRIRREHWNVPKSMGQRATLFMAGLPYWLRKPAYHIYSKLTTIKG